MDNMQGTLGEALQEHASRYGRDIDNDLDYIAEENVADAFGRILGNEQALKEIASTDRGILRRAVDAVKDLITRVQRLFTHRGKGQLSEQERREYRELADRLEEMRDHLMAALEESASSREQSAQRQRQRDEEADRRTDEAAAAEGEQKENAVPEDGDDVKFSI